MKVELCHLLFDISNKWYYAGLSLRVHRNVLNDLNLKTDEKTFFEVNDNFLTTPLYLVTWETVITAIKSPIVNNKETADLIHQYLSTGKCNKFY